MKAKGRTKVGSKAGNPGYRTQATFQGNRSFNLPKWQKVTDLTNKVKTSYSQGS